MEHELSWIELSECLGARCIHFRPLLEAFGSPEAILAASEERLKEAAPELSKTARKAILNRANAARADKILSYCRRTKDVHVYPFDHEKYPSAFRELADPPVLIYCEGTLPDLDTLATVGVVGSRESDAYGEQVAYTMSFELAAAGAVIVSGMAEGIDSVAAAGALAAGGATVSVLGCGIDRTYPNHHKRLRSECLLRGAVITEYAPGTPPNGYNFPIRNRLIAALSRVVLLPQAREGSGALITARHAALYGREIFVVPGDITRVCSAGSNQLLQAGARVALDAEDLLYALSPTYHETLSFKDMEEATQHAAYDENVLRRLGIRDASERKKRAGQKKREKAPEKADVTEREKSGNSPDLSMLDARRRALYDALPDGKFSPDALVTAEISVSDVLSALTLFEVYGLVRVHRGGLYEKV